jgi:hypothetical protein
MYPILANFGTPATGNTGCQSVNPIFANRIAITIGHRTNVAAYRFLRPIAVPRFWLDIF